MVNLSMLKQPPMMLVAIVALMTFVYDFVTRVYSPLSPTPNNNADWSYVVPDVSGLPALPDTLNGWMTAATAEPDETPAKSEVATVPDMIGSAKVGDLNARVRAVFTGSDQLALIEVQKPNEAPKLAAYRMDEMIGDYAVSEITGRFIVLTPANKESQDKEAIHLYVFEPKQDKR